MNFLTLIEDGLPPAMQAAWRFVAMPPDHTSTLRWVWDTVLPAVFEAKNDPAVNAVAARIITALVMTTEDPSILASLSRAMVVLLAAPTVKQTGRVKWDSLSIVDAVTNIWPKTAKAWGHIQILDIQSGLEELRLLRQLRLDVEHWNESGGDSRHLREILETLQELEDRSPLPEDDLAYIKGSAS